MGQDLWDAAKILKKGAGQALKAGQAYVEKQNQKWKDSVTVVYDGESAHETAWSLYQAIREKGYPAGFVAASGYSASSPQVSQGRTIIVGHHKLAKERLRAVGAKYDNYGMKYGFRQSECVLLASRSELGRGKKGRERFAGYYDRRMPFFRDLAGKYQIALQFGARGGTRQSQYDLLLMEFLSGGLREFLALRGSETAVPAPSAEAQANPIRCESEPEKAAGNGSVQGDTSDMKTLREHLGNSIVFTGICDSAEGAREAGQEELLPGEAVAVLYPVGCYWVRIAVCVYRDDETVSYWQQVPASAEEIARFCEENTVSKGYRAVKTVSGRHAAETGMDWHFMCIAAVSRAWGEEIRFAGTVKSTPLVPDERAGLFVHKEYMGSSFCVEHWYKLTPEGTVTEYQIHPYDEDSYTARWE